MTEEVRIFISSPGDVAAERRRAALVIGRLRREFARCFELTPILWEYEPMLASGHFQDIIVPPSTTDIVLVILCSRLGTPLPADRYKGLDGRIPVTGTEWEFEDALRSCRERKVPDLLVYRKPAELAEVHVQIDQLDEAKAQLALLEAFWQRYFLDPAGGFRLAFNSFRTLDGFDDQVERHLRDLLRDRVRRQRPDAAADWYQGSPFRGLQVFEAEHAAIFFGRARAEQAVVEALVHRAAAGSAFVLVLGASGSGKSSLVRAGVLPQLVEPGVVERIELWRRCLFKPSDAAGDLFDGLARALAEQEEALPELADPAAGLGRAGLAAQLRAGAVLPLELALQRAAAAERPAGAPVPEARLVLLVDQMEELFTLRGVAAEQRTAFVALLSALARSGAVWVLGTMRSDFYHRCAELPELVALTAGEGQYHLTAPGTAELEQMIRLPAAAAGIGFEAHPETGIGLDAVLLEAAGGGAAVLPLLEFTLDELYRKDIEQRRGTVLTYASYRELGGEAGGLEGAIARRAEEVCKALPAQVGRELSGLLRALVAIADDTGLATARPVPRAELATTPERTELLDVLIRERLLVSGADPAGEAVVRLAHEALLTHWPMLRALVRKDRDFLRVRGRLLADRVRWEAEGRNPDLLLPRGKRVAEARELLEARRDELDPATAAFIRQSVRRDQRSLWWTRATAAVLAVLAVVAAYVGWLSYDRSVVAERNFGIALTTADTLVRDIDHMKDFVGVSAGQVQGVLRKAEGIFGEILASAGDSPGLRYRKAVMLNTFAAVSLSLGNTGEAKERAEAARSLLQALTADDPDNAEWRSELAVSHTRVGSVLETGGDLAGALAAYRAAQAIREALVAGDPGQTDRQRELAATFNSIGGVLQAEGDLAGALQTFRAGQAILDRGLIDRDPAYTDWQDRLAVSYNRIGGVLQAQGDRASALEAFRNGQAILALLVTQTPGRADWQRDLAISDNSIGGFLQSQDRLDEALEWFRQGQAIYEKLTAQDPDRADWQRELAINHGWVGDVLLALGDRSGALEIYHVGEAILERMAAQHPDQAGWQDELAVSRQRTGNVLGAQGDLDGALEAYRGAQAALAGLTAEQPGNPIRQRDLAGIDCAVAALLMARGDPDRALEAYAAALAAAEQLVALDPRNTGWQRTLSVIQEKIGGVLAGAGDLDTALETAYAARAITVSLVAHRD